MSLPPLRSTQPFGFLPPLGDNQFSQQQSRSALGGNQQPEEQSFPFGASGALEQSQQAQPFGSSIIPGQRMLRIPQQQNQFSSTLNKNLSGVPIEEEGQKKKFNRKNITNGEIILNQIDSSDKIDPEQDITDYDDSLLNVLDMEPVSIKTIIENLKDGNFIVASDSLIQRKLKEMEKVDFGKSQSEYIFLELNSIINKVMRLLDRFIFLFQGILAETDQQSILKTYSRVAIKIDQVFHIMAFISCFGSLYTYLEIKEQSEKTQSPQDKKFYFQSMMATTFYGIAYLLTIINHKFCAQISDTFPQISDNTIFFQQFNRFQNDFQTWRILQIIITILTLLGWLISVSTTESQLNFVGESNYNDDINNQTLDTEIK